jgi:large subunit ribosomal protein L22
MKAYLKNYRQAPRKVRLLADLIRGRSVEQAQLQLIHAGKKAALAMGKLLSSATANAKHNDSVTEGLFVEEVRVDDGVTIKRFQPRAYGRAFPIRRRTSNIILKLGVKVEEEKKERKATVKTESKTATKKTATKKVAKKEELVNSEK